MTEFTNWANIRASYTHEAKDAEILRLKRIIKKLKQELKDSYETVTEIKREHEEDIKRLTAPATERKTRMYLDFSNVEDMV
jgi:ribosomal protein S13